MSRRCASTWPMRSSISFGSLKADIVKIDLSEDFFLLQVQQDILSAQPGGAELFTGKQQQLVARMFAARLRSVPIAEQDPCFHLFAEFSDGDIAIPRNGPVFPILIPRIVDGP